MASTFQNGVMYACFAVLALLACVCTLVGFRQVGMWLRARLCPIALVSFASAAIIATCDAQKRGNEAARASRGEYTVSITPRSVGEAELLPLPGAVTNAKWRAHGAFEDAFYIRATNWWARMPDGRWMDRLRILSSGGFRARGVGGGAWTNYPAPFEQKLSLAPEANWPLLDRDSSFWHATTPSNTLVVSWIGGLYARSHTNLVDFQAEIFNDGSLDYRYADRTEHFAASLPFDLDGDGLENSVDPDPLTAGPDAHGTNAEWYNTVCSNVLEAVASGITGTTGILPVDGDCVLSWCADVNSNAYYFVDVVTERGPAPIYFTGDRDSRLGNPVVVALAGVTNRVPLLIGVDYAVTSDTPFTVSFPIDYIHPTVTTNGVADYNVRWPLNFVFTESLTESNRVYTVTVEPYDPGGVLTWEGGGMRSGASSGCGCGCLSCMGFSIGFNCSAICTCHGECHAVGGYAFEDTLFAVTGGVCRCGFDDPPPDSPPSSHGPNDPPSLTITFSKPAVIFEDAYEDKPGVTVPRRSTRVRLTIDAYGGPAGANLWLTGVNLGKLVAVNGGASFPYSQMLAPGESYYATGMYDGVLESGVANDIKVSGSLVPNEQGENIQTNAQLTVIRILLTPEVNPPSEATSGRHTYGVCEFVRLFQFPSIPAVVWNPAGGGSNAVSRTGYSCYRFPLNACENPLRAEVDEVFYVPRLSCIEPSGIIAREVELCTYGLPAGKAGGVGLLLAFYVTPFTVSVSEIAVEEVPCDDGSVNGYFRHVMPTNAWSHTRLAGAGIWDDVDLDNRVSGRNRIRDEAGIYEELPPITPDGTITNDYSYGWMDGLMIWQIPFGWHVRGTSGETDPSGNIAGTTQEFYIDQWGHAAVRKFNNQATRRIDDRRFFNGVEVHGNIVIQQTE